MITDEQIKEWRKLADDYDVPDYAISYRLANDVDFVVAVREALPALLDEVERLRADNAKWKDYYETVRKLAEHLRVELKGENDEKEAAESIAWDSATKVNSLCKEIKQLRAELMTTIDAIQEVGVDHCPACGSWDHTPECPVTRYGAK